MIDVSLLESRRTALTDLLDRIIVGRADHGDAFRRIYLHEEWLRAWLMERPAWRLMAGHGVYRLERLPSFALPERGLPRLRWPMDYACLSWTLWFAERRRAEVRDWFVLSELADQVASAATGVFTLGLREHREALVRAVTLLVELGVLNHRDGDADRWAIAQQSVDGPIEVLYEFAEDAPRLLANFDPAGLECLAVPPPDGRTLKRTGEFASAKARAWRALLLGPIFWRSDDPEAFATMENSFSDFVDDLEYTLGWQIELRRDFARVWRVSAARGATASLIDLVPVPGDGQTGGGGAAAEQGGERRVRYIYHPIMLLAAVLREELAAGRLSSAADGSVEVSSGELRDLILALQREYRHNWGVELGQLGSAELADQVLAQMRLIGYLRGPDVLDRCTLLPPAFLIAGQYERAEAVTSEETVSSARTELRRARRSQPRSRAADSVKQVQATLFGDPE